MSVIIKSRCASIGFAVFALIALLAAAVDVIAQGPAEMAAIARAADIAREKDVVWLSLVTAIVSLLFCAWLVHKIITLGVKQIDATKLQAEAGKEQAIAINKLREEMERKGK